VRSHAAWDTNNTIRSDWDFDTVRTMSASGTYRGIVNDLLPSTIVSEDNEPFDDTEMYESIDSEHTINIDTQDEALSGTILYSILLLD
jgi:serine/threonine-protein kinase 24/25/MST4